MAQVDFAPIAHQSEALLTTAGARARVNAAVKNDPSVVNHATYYSSVASARASVEADQAAEVAFHDSLAPLWLDLKNAETVEDVTAAKVAIINALAERYIVEQP